MKSLFTPIRALYSRIAPCESWQFIADTDRTFVVDACNLESEVEDQVTLTIGATPKSAAQLLKAANIDISTIAWMRVVSISGGTVYGKPMKKGVITSTIGWTLAANDRIGFAPNTGTFVASVGGSTGGGGGDASAANQEEQIAALGNVTGSISVSAALPVGDEGNATVTLNGAAGVEFEVTAVSGLHVTVEAVLASGGTYREVESYQIAGGYERHRKAGQDITLASADRIFVPGDYYAVRLKRASGTSATVTTRTLGPGMVAKLLAAPIEYKPLSNQNIANGTLDDAGGTLLTVPTGAMGAWITLIETTLGTPAYVYMTTDGGTPSATDGATLKCLNQPFEMIGSDLIAAVKFLAVDAGSRLNAEYFEIVRRVG